MCRMQLRLNMQFRAPHLDDRNAFTGPEIDHEGVGVRLFQLRCRKKRFAIAGACAQNDEPGSPENGRFHTDPYTSAVQIVRTSIP